MKLQHQYYYQTLYGGLSISHGVSGWFLCLNDNRFDGPFHSPVRALDELVNGTCRWPRMINPSSLKVPSDLAEWHFENSWSLV